eukprot:TRINITY_DN8922_c0_g1_i1.p1 TRINITY_DN8922_c0_g1~~TRINITY_DN8922_c0_g1_i1.p1  ORF type:complete len:197 (-),score=8.73 TRINITY_DN8922_c0_g1_i1:81-671(-)
MVHRLPYDFRFRLGIVGDYGTGKTTFAARVETDQFFESRMSYLGKDCAIKHVTVDESVVRLLLWDPHSNERFREVSAVHFKGDGVIIMYDCTNIESFLQLDRWMLNVEVHSKDDIVTVIVASKSDLVGEKVIDPVVGEEYAKCHGASFFEISSVDGRNIDVLLDVLARKLLKRHALQLPKPQTPEEPKKQGRCVLC